MTGTRGRQPQRAFKKVQKVQKGLLAREYRALVSFSSFTFVFFFFHLYAYVDHCPDSDGMG